MNAPSWICLHIHYGSNADPMLVQCIAPLVHRLRARGLLHRWFFIRYWVEGPHLRVRLLPVDAVAAVEVRETARAAVDDFLRRRPALYDPSVKGVGDLHRRMFVAEYGEEAWTRRYGPGDGMPIRPNNTVYEEPYEPEYDRYGGPAGIGAAERNFEASSDLVLRLLATTNSHVRSVRLGASMRVTAALCLVFLGDRAAVVRFLAGYRHFWHDLYGERDDRVYVAFDRGFDRIATEARSQLGRLADAVADPGRARLTTLERGWIGHAHSLREEVFALADAGLLAFRRRDTADATGRQDAAAALLGSLVHMANNRLGISIFDEIHLAYLIERALGAPEGSGVTTPADAAARV